MERKAQSTRMLLSGASLFLVCTQVFAVSAPYSPTIDAANTACQRQAFGLSISPTQWVTKGSVANYIFTIVNNDTAECPPSRFFFYVNPHIGWIRPQLSVESTTISAGASATIAFSVKVSSAAQSALYPLSINVFNPTPPASGNNVTTSIGVR